MALLFILALLNSDSLWLQAGFQQFKLYMILGSSLTKNSEYLYRYS